MRTVTSRALAISLILVSCVSPRDGGSRGDVESGGGSGAPGDGVTAALQTEVIQPFQSREPSAASDTHAQLFRQLLALLQRNEYVKRDFKELSAKYRIDPRKFARSTEEVFLTRARDGEPAVIIHLSRANAPKSGESIFSASVIWFVYGGVENDRRVLVERTCEDLGLWWAGNSPFVGSR